MQSGTILFGEISQIFRRTDERGKASDHGSAADWLACGMQGGEIRVHGDAADNAIGSLMSPTGMTGAENIDGSVVLSRRQKRGLLAIGGNAGEQPANFWPAR